ncbi:PTS sugar transporter subunit IIA [Youngiibacter fragilis]|uniref:PTS glucose transporter subunit IIA n=1 Tax=Youngiibacter fragilis 232.1 TaxID=994573 RepID=V7I381_9CLOT|nr:glucose PTS transporter subunit IIA [Youngiibacter fragilis]ETA79741.1 PTS glucose transporter subunit IIA [Youngiibacter fragilis 232.1]
MGFFDKLRGNNNKTKINKLDPVKLEKNTVYAPVAGELISLADFPDETFSEGILGQGCGIRPSEELVKAPFDGEVVALLKSYHALGLRSNNGIELLIHVGVDTVTMEGRGFTPFVKIGDKIAMGQDLLRFSMSEIHAAGFDASVAVVVTNSDAFKTIEAKESSMVGFGEPILKLE